MIRIWLAGLLRRRGGRLIGVAAGVAMAVALLAALGGFLGATRATMTAQSVRGVVVDWQVQAASGADARQVLTTVQHTPGTPAALPVGFASTSGLSATTGGTSQTTGPGAVMSIPAGYRATFPGEIRVLAGRGDGVLLAQQTAANLHAAPGDTVAVGRAGLPPVKVRVDGVVDLPQADTLFQKVGAPPQSQPTAPPDNVVLLPQARWHTAFDPLAKARPDLVHDQIHARRSHALPHDPAAAYTTATGSAHNTDLRLAGTGVVGDNLGAVLDAARSDALYAQMLFLFLGVPGAVLAGALTAAVAGAGAARRRREQALLRTRGASAGRLLALAAVEAGVVAVVGGAAGLGVAALLGRTAFGTAGTFTAGWALAALAVGAVIAGGTVLLPAHRDIKAATVVAGRAAVEGRRVPRTAWWVLAIGLLAGALVVFRITSRTNYALILAPEGTPTLSVDYWAFAAPALLWTGGALLAWLLVDLVLRRCRPVLARLLRPATGALSGTVAASLSRQRGTVLRAVVLLALAIAFAASTAVFNSTYHQQAGVDAVLTNGADVTVAESPGSTTGAADAARVSALPGVRSVEPLQHRFAYVGPDLQDLYGVRPSTVVAAGRLQDAYFSGGTARQLTDRLQRQPDGLLVSAETANDFQLHPGDQIRLRLQDNRTHRLRPVVFRFVGVVKEFPTAPKDSFLVANSSYVARATGSGAVGTLLVDTGGTGQRAVARNVRSALGPTAHVTDLPSARTVTGSSLTAVNLGGLTRVELGFALVIGAAAGGLVLALGLTERRRTLALASVLGARGRQLSGFVWSEAGLVAVAGAAGGVLLGWSLSEVLVKVLSGVFDPPPAALAVPWGYLGALAVAVAAALAIAAWTAVRHARRPPLTELREL
ncbi:putative ABC transport system permease protein [Streptomyces sp. 2333.5]|uniref:FtsX-like permease family protein n=1 Tax=unclassified Streptomyces TaxID=2593676 RepID=UPI000899D66A|nr:MULTISPECIES: FtsX-like permease family protein [unclassified Streptomyces]PJJ06040.1 putative ABC transport system permease protein [Streptomyces sp. 2333.5]SEE89099.1 putative ABC transport system permease protein [Streptomyces sp. 2314.4]SEF06266.1 putative ABC transport system permease protein [Streptomyces sp. 2112.2]